MEFILPILMLLCLFKIKNKIGILIAWIMLYFCPFFIMVYDGEQRNLEIAQSMGENINLLDWYIGIIIISVMWASMLFLVTLFLYLLIKSAFK